MATTPWFGCRYGALQAASGISNATYYAAQLTQDQQIHLVTHTGNSNDSEGHICRDNKAILDLSDVDVTYEGGTANPPLPQTAVDY